MKEPLRIGCCVTPHGFGHAARISAVMQEMKYRADIRFVLVTTVPKWFFEQSIGSCFEYYEIQTDVGMVQRTSLQSDLEATVKALDAFYPVSEELVSKAAAIFSGCQMVLCDIAPLGILAAHKAGIRSVLVENFTWDWIYGYYLDQEERFRKHIRYLRDIYGLADFHIRTEPSCDQSRVDLTAAPIVRRTMGTVKAIRQRFGIQKEEKLVLLTMGGCETGPVSLRAAAELDGYHFVFPGFRGGDFSCSNIHILPQMSTLYHPDLVSAADIVVGKVGYSTIAEICQAQAVFGYVKRPEFPESRPLENFIIKNIPSFEIQESELVNGSWVEKILLLPANTLQRRTCPPSGAKDISDVLLQMV